ncbi:hypothetical protein AUC68_05150 [Methyloceanibacter methanicus]|uniref:Uncharacterized protein n=1 Tax=Methyloceanibacter methanicus TaxID=1774968 RepID=A0A1E3W0S4_9HYPH|nr:hypothetical protein [Methyloceanibacter methanicus]ODR99359.1 hypothetical protein AUC68_05150 [Methyloceanibacter methanicus]
MRKKTVSRGQVSRLDLVYPPISNQEAVWLEDDPEVQERLRASNLYMIGGRPEARFTDIELDDETHTVRFNVCVGDLQSEPAALRLSDIPGIRGHDEYYLEAGEKMFRAWDGPVRADGSNVLNWFTTDKLLWDKSRGLPGIEGLDRVSDLMTYDLLYVGIAKKNDTFERLFKRGHKARVSILAHEPQRYPGARVTDETFLFAFRVEPLLLQTFDPDHDFTEEDFMRQPDEKRVLADVEKAFVSLLKPQYNIIKYGNYPKGSDGLYGTGIDRYGYLIGERIAFNTAHGRIRGAYDPRGMISNEADFIFVDGDKVSFYVSGVDFPATTRPPKLPENPGAC